MFKLGCTSDKIWNLTEFIEYLVTNQNKSLNIIIFPEAVCLETLGVYKLIDMFNFDQVTIHTHNQFEKNSKYNIVFQSNQWLKKQEIEIGRAHV